MPLVENDEHNTIKVYLIVAPSLAAIFGIGTLRWHVVSREITTGMALGDALTIFALNYPEFRKAVFDPTERKLFGTVHLALNGVIQDPLHKIETELVDGDRITIIPAYDSG